MENRTFIFKTQQFKRVDKKTAARAYKMGAHVMLVPCKADPVLVYSVPMFLHRSSREQFVIDEIGLVNDFYNQVASFEYYNCKSDILGRYAAFYIPYKIIDRDTGERREYNGENTACVCDYDFKY